MKFNYTLFSFLILSFLVFSSCQDNGNDSKSTAKTYVEVCEGYDAIDKEMLDLIDQITEERKSEVQFIRRFRDEQVYWIQYKDRHIRTLYPEDWDLYYRKNYGKQVFNSCKCKELIRKTEDRVAELKMYLKSNSGPEGQLECPSSWNKKSAQ